MPTFSPPTVADESPVSFDPAEIARNPLGFRLFRHYSGRPRGRSVLKSVAGVYSTVDNPTQDQIDAAAFCYLGGHSYWVSAAEKTALEAAGYTVDAADPPPSFFRTGTEFEYSRYTAAPPVEVITVVP